MVLPPEPRDRREVGQALLETVSDLGGPALVTVRSRSVLASGLIGIGGCLLAVAGYVVMQTCMTEYLDTRAPVWLDPALRVLFLAIAVVSLIAGLTATRVREAQVNISRLGIEMTWETGEGEAVVGRTVRVEPEEVRELRDGALRYYRTRTEFAQTFHIRTYRGATYEFEFAGEGMDPETWQLLRQRLWQQGDVGGRVPADKRGM